METEPTPEEPPRLTTALLTVTAAAKAAQVDRKTIRRRLTAGGFPGAQKAEDGTWRIPAPDLLAAGFHLSSRPETRTARGRDPRPEVEAEARQWRERALVAEARADGLRAESDALRRALDASELALRALTAGDVIPGPGSGTEPPPDPGPSTPAPLRLRWPWQR